MTRVLILGGTRDARILAGLCVDALGPDVRVITSLAGRTRSPQDIAGHMRVGGFGGTQGLIDYLQGEDISVLVDATHPFAEVISRNAAHAAQETGIAHVMIERPLWALPAELLVMRVSSLEDAAKELHKRDARNVFVTTGINGLAVFAGNSDRQFLIRQIEDHEGPPPFANAEIIVQKPPFTVAGEHDTMASHNIDTLVSKESGGGATEAKLLAAAELGVHVIMIERPALPAGNRVPSPEEALNWIRDL